MDQVTRQRIGQFFRQQRVRFTQRKKADHLSQETVASLAGIGIRSVRTLEEQPGGKALMGVPVQRLCELYGISHKDVVNLAIGAANDET